MPNTIRQINNDLIEIVIPLPAGATGVEMVESNGVALDIAVNGEVVSDAILNSGTDPNTARLRPVGLDSDGNQVYNVVFLLHRRGTYNPGGAINTLDFSRLQVAFFGRGDLTYTAGARVFTPTLSSHVTGSLTRTSFRVGPGNPPASGVGYGKPVRGIKAPKTAEERRAKNAYGLRNIGRR